MASADPKVDKIYEYLQKVQHHLKKAATFVKFSGDWYEEMLDVQYNWGRASAFAAAFIAVYGHCMKHNERVDLEEAVEVVGNQVHSAFVHTHVKP